MKLSSSFLFVAITYTFGVLFDCFDSHTSLAFKYLALSVPDKGQPLDNLWIKTLNSGNINSWNVPDIYNYYTKLSTYDFPEITNRYLLFSIKACDNVFVLLSETYTLTSTKFLEIVFGGNSNLISYVWLTKYPGNIISAPHYSTPNLLSCTAFRSFNLSWPSDDRFVRLTDSGKVVFDWTSGDTLDIRGIGVRSGWGNDATWIVNHKAHTSGHYRGLKSTYGNMNLLRTTSANSLILCILVCDRDNNCIGINFHLKTKKCELIEGGQLIKKTANSEWMFYTKCLQGSKMCLAVTN